MPSDVPASPPKPHQTSTHRRLRRNTVRDLRNHVGDVLDRVVRGESVTITAAGVPVAELRPLVSAGLSTCALVERLSCLPAMDPMRLRQDLESVFDARV